MTHSITVRLDDVALRALAQLEATGLTRSEAVGTALVAAAERLAGRWVLAAEVADLEADPDERAELEAVAELMAGLRPPV